tara:strand:- start:411 stop:647 length:237 start_codon:yes stop_codon:yes gene_type:complete
MMSLKAYYTWLNKAKKNDRISYYRGFLCDPKLQPIDSPDNERVVRLRNKIYESYAAGLITLVQKKHGNFDYEYMAVRK